MPSSPTPPPFVGDPTPTNGATPHTPNSAASRHMRTVRRWLRVASRLALSVWLISTVVIVTASDGTSDFYGVPFWARAIVDGALVGMVLLYIWERPL